MNILDTADAVMTEYIRVGTSGTKLSTLIRQMVRNQDNIIKIYEGMSDDYANNMTDALGEDGMAEALQVYQDIKVCRDALKAKGI